MHAGKWLFRGMTATSDFSQDMIAKVAPTRVTANLGPYATSFPGVDNDLSTAIEDFEAASMVPHTMEELERGHQRHKGSLKEIKATAFRNLFEEDKTAFDPVEEVTEEARASDRLEGVSASPGKSPALHRHEAKIKASNPLFAQVEDLISRITDHITSTKCFRNAYFRGEDPVEADKAKAPKTKKGALAIRGGVKEPKLPKRARADSPDTKAAEKQRAKTAKIAEDAARAKVALVKKYSDQLFAIQAQLRDAEKRATDAEAAKAAVQQQLEQAEVLHAKNMQIAVLTTRLEAQIEAHRARQSVAAGVSPESNAGFSVGASVTPDQPTK